MTSIFSLVTTATDTHKSGFRAAPRRFLVALVICAGLLATCAEASVAAESNYLTDADGGVFCNGVRLQDEIVVINTRNICGSCSTESFRNRIGVETYAIHDEAGCRRWQRSDLDSFLTSDPSVPTIIFIHGNQITPGWAKSEGLSVYRRLMKYGGHSGPIRFVIFSWPSERVGRILRDARVKAARTGPAGLQLAWLLDQMPAETPVSLVGFSFGARIITGGLHILGGGSLGGALALPERFHPDRQPVNVVLLSAALHAHWLGRGQHHGLAMTQVNELLLLNNSQDRAMRYYHFLTPGRGGPQALGLRGPTRISSESAVKIQKRDVGRYVGSQHDLNRYLCAPGVLRQIWDYSARPTFVEPTKLVIHNTSASAAGR